MNLLTYFAMKNHLRIAFGCPSEWNGCRLTTSLDDTKNPCFRTNIQFAIAG